MDDLCSKGCGTEQIKVCNDPYCRHERLHKNVFIKMNDTNTIRGAAIALCMNVEELKALINGASKNKDNDEVAKLRIEISAIKSENSELKEKILKLQRSLEVANETIVNLFLQ